MRNIQHLFMVIVLFLVALTSGCVYAPHTGTSDPYNTSRSVDTYRIQRNQLKNWYHAQLQAINEQEHIRPSTRSNRRYYAEQRRILRAQYNTALKTINERERNQRKIARENERQYRRSPAGIFQQEFQSEANRTIRRTAREAARDFFRF